MDTTNYFEAAMDTSKWAKQLSWSKLRNSAKVYDWRYDIWSYFTRNAYNDFIKNFIEVTGPELLLQDLFSLKVPSYINFGDLGTTIGHELIHSLDNTGVYFNETGGFEDWFNEDSRYVFYEKAECIIHQYSAFNDTKYTQMTLNGYESQGENMADNGGLKLAYNAYRRLAKQLSVPEPRLPGLQQYTPDQLFLLSAANYFCEVPDKEQLKKQIEKDPHSPHEFRVKGEMMNSHVFSNVFNCAKDTPMNPVHKCEIW